MRPKWCENKIKINFERSWLRPSELKISYFDSYKLFRFIFIKKSSEKNEEGINWCHKSFQFILHNVAYVLHRPNEKNRVA